MPRSTSTSSSEETNGRNGAVIRSEITENSNDVRKAVTIQGIFGSNSDARVLYLAVSGNTGDGWAQLERILTPVRRYVIEGEEPYIKPSLSIEQHSGVPTPDGDCAEEALPPELRNQNREAEKIKLGGTGYDLATRNAT